MNLYSERNTHSFCLLAGVAGGRDGAAAIEDLAASGRAARVTARPFDRCIPVDIDAVGKPTLSAQVCGKTNPIDVPAR